MSISDPFPFKRPVRLSPFALGWAFPIADYYGDSVALGLAPGRRSHVPVMLNVSSLT